MKLVPNLMLCKKSVLPAALLALALPASSGGTLTLPEALLHIEDEAFYQDSSIEGVILPEGLESIGERAFAGTGVTSVQFPDSLSYIAEDAFEDTSLTDVTASPGSCGWNWAASHGFYSWTCEVQEDGTLALTGYTGSEGVLTLPEEIGGVPVTAIADEAFAGNSVLVNVTVPGTIRTIGEAAFAGSSKLKRVNVQQGVSYIGSQAFTDCPVLTRAILPESGVTLGNKIFKYCYSLKTVNLPEGITELPLQMFWECQSLTGITLPEGIETIAPAVFYNCISMASANVPESVTSIGDKAFFTCSSLLSLTLTENVTYIHDLAFSNCDELIITAPEGSVAWTYAQEHLLIPENVVLESPHPYTESGTWTYQYPGEASALKVTFSHKTYIFGDKNTDSLVITDATGTKKTYKGDTLAAQTLILPGSSFTIKLNAVSPMYAYGFRITAVEAVETSD